MGKQCYGGVVGKSMKAVELAVSQKDDWRNIAITLIDRVVSVIAFYEKVIKVKADVAAYLINCFPSV
jgi:hypothetical protein